MSVKLILAAATLAAGIATLSSQGGSVVDTAEAAQGPKCAKVALQGLASLRGWAGTEKKVRVAAIANWEAQARDRLGLNYDSWSLSSGQAISCQRKLLTVRCQATSTPCTLRAR